MSEEVAPKIIQPAKSEDKLEIEKEEKERLEAEAKENEELAKTEDDEKDTEEDKKFKIKTPNLVGYLRSRSKSRDNKKKKDDDEKKEEDKKEGDEKGEKQKPGPKGGKKKKNRGKRKPKAMNKKKEDDEEEAGEKEKEGEEAKEEEEDNKEEAKMDNEDKDDKEDKDNKEKDEDEKKNKDGEGEEAAKNEDKEEKEKMEEDKEEKKEENPSGFFAALKSSMPAVPALFSRKSSKDKDPEKAEEEEQELLEQDSDKEDKDDKETKEDKEDKDKEDKDEDNKEKEEKKTEPEEEKKAEAKDDKEAEKPKDETDGSKSKGFFNKLKNMPAMFSLRGGDRVADIEIGETKQLLNEDEDDKEKQKQKSDEDSNKKSESGDLEEVKVIGDDEKKDADAASAAGSEKKDAEKGEKEEEKCKVKKRAALLLTQAQGLDKQKKCGLCGVIIGLLLLLLLIILLAVCAPGGKWTNEARVVKPGSLVETHTTCGPVEGLYDGPNQFSFRGIPFAVPIEDSETRWTHSRPAVSLAECYEGKFFAHDQNDDAAAANADNETEAASVAPRSECYRRLPGGDYAGEENCLFLDVFTPNLVYNELMPVVVYVNGEDLHEDEDQELRPSSAVAMKHGVVFVTVNYRRGALGFLSLKSLSKRTYPHTSGNYGLGDIVSALQWVKLNIQHFGGHPAKVTLLGRGSGATLVTALTAVPKARGLFAGVWATNGHGSYENKTLEEANKENKILLNHLACGADELQCLLNNRNASDIMKSAPEDWDIIGDSPDLPSKGEIRDHAWLTADKFFLFENPIQYWKDHRLTNKIPMVIGSTAQVAATTENLASSNWTTAEYVSRVRSKLDQFNATVTTEALKLYNDSQLGKDPFSSFVAMVSDIRTVCPLQDLAMTASNNFVSNVYSYVSTMPRTSDLGDLADRTSDISAIFGTYIALNEQEKKYQLNMENMFYTFVRKQELPSGDKDLTQGMYQVSDKLVTQKEFTRCAFWKNKIEGLIPDYSYIY